MYDVDDELDQMFLSTHPNRKMVRPRDYLKAIEDADKVFDSLSSEKRTARPNKVITTMLAQTQGILSADKGDFATSATPRVPTEFHPKIIKDDIPIICDEKFFKFKDQGTRERKTEKQKWSNQHGIIIESINVFSESE